MSDSRTGAGAVGYREVLVATSIGNLIEVYDILIYGYFATVLSRQFSRRAIPPRHCWPRSRSSRSASLYGRLARSSSATSATGSDGTPRSRSRCCS
jgi:hypothetical protein